MTSNQIAYMEAKIKQEDLKERKRSNQMKEALERSSQKLTKRGQNFKMAGDVLGTVLDAGAKMSNDKSWYEAEPQLVKDAASISFNNPLGNSIKTMFDKPDSTAKISVPGIMVLRFMPTLGALEKNGNASTADIAAKSLYSYVRYANSGARNYESSDLMMYLLAAGQAYAYYGYLCRCYSLLCTSKAANRYYVNAMLEASGLDAKNFRNKASNLRSYINTYAVRLNSMYIPKDLPYLTRHIWMNTGIFKDAPVKKSQEYFFLQKDFLCYDDINGRLTVFPQIVSEEDYDQYAHDFRPNANFTYDQITKTGDLLINQLVQSEVVGLMAGDVMKAYGENNMAYADVIPENFHIESVYNPEVLSQIHNALFSGIITTGFSDEDRLRMFDIYQTSINGVDFLAQGKPYYDSNEDAIARTNAVGFGFPTTMGMTQAHYVSRGLTTENSILNFQFDDVQPSDVMVATRLQFVVDDKPHYFTVGDGAASIQTGAITDMGSEIALDFYVARLESDTGKLSVTPGMATFLDYSAGEIASRLPAICIFDWHPRVAQFDNYGAAIFGFSDLANYTTLANVDKKNMNYVAMLSELGIPKLGLSVRNRR